MALGSLVFLAIEVQQGHEQGAIIHFRSREMILKSFITNNNVEQHQDVELSKMIFQQTTSCNDTSSDDIITAFTRLSVEEGLFCGSLQLEFHRYACPPSIQHNLNCWYALFNDFPLLAKTSSILIDIRRRHPPCTSPRDLNRSINQLLGQRTDLPPIPFTIPNDRQPDVQHCHSSNFLA